jgi:hypothetical protein
MEGGSYHGCSTLAALVRGSRHYGPVGAWAFDIDSALVISKPSCSGPADQRGEMHSGLSGPSPGWDNRAEATSWRA